MVLDQRQHAHALLDLLSLTRVPMDDEPLAGEMLTDEMLAKLKRAEASAGQRIPHEQILEEFGLRS